MSPRRTRLAPLAPLLASLLAACVSSAAHADGGPVGHWRGTVVSSHDTLAITFTIALRGDSLHATISAPDLMLLDQPLRVAEWDPPRLRLESTTPAEPVRFEATLAGDTLRGTMRVDGSGGEPALPTMALTLVRAEPGARPYRTEDVVFRHGTTTLSGTLFLPPGRGPHPAVMLVHGSSLDLRDGYRHLADRFARDGVAALIYDKRGAGASGGNTRLATLDDLVGDAVAGVAWLGARRDIDVARIGVWGLSQGAMLAPLIGQRANAAFIVAVSGPGVSFGEAAAYQDSLGLLRRGFPASDAAAAAAVHRRLTGWIDTGGDSASLAALLRRTADAPWRRHTGIPRHLPSPEDRAGWYWATRPLDPAEWWRTLRIPALVLFGADDELLPAEWSAGRIEAALRAAGNRDARVMVFPGGDHMLRRGGGGASGRWSWPRPVAGYPDVMLDWIGTVTNGGRRPGPAPADSR